MRVALDWLAELATQVPPASDLAEALTMRGLETEQAGRAGPELPGVVVGKVVRCAAIGGTALKDCRVSVGSGVLRIVCGAPNVQTGAKVAVALPEAVLGGHEIGEREIRGVLSRGMICSERELGLGDDHEGILRLDPRSKVGAPLERALALGAQVLEVAVTPNRGDCLSMLGIAREVVASCGGRLKKVRSGFAPQSDEKQDVRILEDAHNDCPLYGSVVIRGVSRAGAPSPLWMRERLRRAGARPIGAAVDATNYVMLALGQPLHAFDLNRLQGGIRVRFARPGERLVLLDGQDAQLRADTLVIADERRAVALGGVMGGMETGVSSETTDMLLEGAFFRPEVVRGRTRAYGLNSGAAFRFERGVDFTGPRRALEHAARLIVGLCGGRAGPVQLTRAGELPQRRPITMPAKRFGELLGLEQGAASAARMLRRLGFEASATKRTVTATPPPYRFDVSIPEDLAEEIARAQGYNNLPATVPRAAGAPLPPPGESRGGGLLRVKRALASRGYFEVVTYAFVPERWESGLHGNANPVRLSNPITDEATVMRSSLIGGLLGRASHNHKHRQSRLQIFEAGRCFPSESSVTGDQPLMIAGLCYGHSVPKHWDDSGRDFDFFDVRSDVEMLFARRRAADFAPCAHRSAFHPGKCADVKACGRIVGCVGALHPLWVQEFELPPSTHLFELSVDSVLESMTDDVAIDGISKLPLVYRDLSVVVGADIPAGEVLKAGMRLEERKEVRKVELFDKYEGGGEAVRGMKRLGFRLTLQGTEANLEEHEISALVGELEDVLGKAFDARRTATET